MDNDYELLYLAKEDTENIVDILYEKYKKVLYSKALKYSSSNLNIEDYYQGPGKNQSSPNDGDVWMFGIGIKKKRGRKKIPIYIKIYITKAKGTANYCISFHIAKFEMNFPYKTEL